MGNKKSYWKGKKKKATPLSTEDVGPQPPPGYAQPNEEKLNLICENPNDQRSVVFELKEGQSSCTYSIFDKSSRKQLYSISESDVGNEYFLSVREYKYTLDEFLGRTAIAVIDGIEVNEPVPKFATLAGGVDVLDYSLSQVVASLLSEVSTLHFSGHYHGGLDNRSNIVIIENIRRKVSTFKVVLVHEEITPSLGTVLLGKRKDFDDIIDIIFQVILPQVIATKTHWIELKYFLTHFYTTPNHTFLPLPLNHSATWNWERRLEFFDILHFAGNQPVIGTDILSSIRNLTQYSKWKRQIVRGTILQNLFNDYYYHNDIVGLVHFLRDVPFHVNDLTRKTKVPYYDRNKEPDWQHGWYVEYHINLLWPNLITDIMNQLYQDDIPTAFLDNTYRE